MIYTPRMEIYKNDECGSTCIDVWQDFGVFNNIEDAEKILKILDNKIKKGEYNDKLTNDCDGMELCIEHLNNDYSLVDIYDYTEYIYPKEDLVA